MLVALAKLDISRTRRYDGSASDFASPQDCEGMETPGPSSSLFPFPACYLQSIDDLLQHTALLPFPVQVTVFTCR